MLLCGIFFAVITEANSRTKTQPKVKVCVYKEVIRASFIFIELLTVVAGRFEL